MSPASHSRLLDDPLAQTLASGDLAAVFLPGRGMLGASLRHRGVEILRRVEDLEAAAAKGSTAGIPLLHPWANRLAGLRYRAAGKETTLDPSSSLLHLDGHGLPMHGVPWSRLAWSVAAATSESVSASLDWSRPDLLAVFPYAHELRMTATLAPDALTIETTLVAGAERRPGQLRLSPVRRAAGRAARRVDAAAPGHAASRSRRERHPDRRGDPGLRRRRAARRPRVRRRLRAPRGVIVVFRRGRRPPGDGGDPSPDSGSHRSSRPWERSSSPSSP